MWLLNNRLLAMSIPLDRDYALYHKDLEAKWFAQHEQNAHYDALGEEHARAMEADARRAEDEWCAEIEREEAREAARQRDNVQDVRPPASSDFSQSMRRKMAETAPRSSRQPTTPDERGDLGR